MIDTTSKNCRLSIYKSDFELIISEDGKTVKSCQSAGFQLLIKQAKANYGIRKGRFMFEIKILRYLESEEFKGFNATAKNQIVNESLKDSKHQIRVGWSTQYARTSSDWNASKSNMIEQQNIIQRKCIKIALGVDHDSCGYENTGTRFYAGNYKKYGESFGVGDVIRCCIDLEGQNKHFSFYKNGQFQGIAYRISSKQNDKAYYPSINIRNAEVQFNFGNLPEEFFPVKNDYPLSIPTSLTGVGAIGQNPQDARTQNAVYPIQQIGQQYLAQAQAYVQGQQTYLNAQSQQIIPVQQVIPQQSYVYGQQQQPVQSGYGAQTGFMVSQPQVQYPQSIAYVQPTTTTTSYSQEHTKHISIPNAQNLVSKEEIIISQYTYINYAPEDSKEHELVQQSESCEAIFMVGLPASGKTTFAQGYVKRNPDTILLGSFEIFEHIVSNLQKQNQNQNLTLLMEICNHIMENSMRLIAKQQIRSVVIDQCNVMLKARLKKLRIFSKFVKKAYVLVVSDTDQRKRMLKRERSILNQCQMYPKLCLESFRNLQEHFVIPTKEEGFSEIQYLEIDEEISSRVALMNNLIAISEVHPLLKPYDFKRVKAIKEAQEKLKLQAIQQQQLKQLQQVNYPPQSIIVPLQIPGAPIPIPGVPIPNSSAPIPNPQQSEQVSDEIQQGDSHVNEEDQQALQNQQENQQQDEMNLGNEDQQYQQDQNQFEEEDQQGNENSQNNSNNGQEDFENNQEESEQWEQNNSNQQEMMNKGEGDEDDEQMMEDQQQE